MREPGLLLHLGASGYYKHLSGAAGDDFRLRQRPESYVFSTRLADTGVLPADGLTTAGMELAGVIGPVSIQAEHLVSRVDSREQGELDFDGSYIYLSWFPTGESRS